MQQITKKTRHLQKTIRQNIHQIRQKKKLTLKKISRRTGLTIHLLDQYELGKNQMQLYELTKIAAALGIRLELLLQSNI